MEHDQVLRTHGYHPLKVTRVVQETDDTRSYVLDVPTEYADLFAYEPGQFCVFRVYIDGTLDVTVSGARGAVLRPAFAT